MSLPRPQDKFKRFSFKKGSVQALAIKLHMKTPPAPEPINTATMPKRDQPHTAYTPSTTSTASTISKSSTPAKSQSPSSPHQLPTTLAKPTTNGIAGSKFHEHMDNDVPGYGECPTIMQSLKVMEGYVPSDVRVKEEENRGPEVESAREGV